MVFVLEVKQGCFNDYPGKTELGMEFKVFGRDPALALLH
jgi:hypothetical protein